LKVHTKPFLKLFVILLQAKRCDYSSNYEINLRAFIFNNAENITIDFYIENCCASHYKMK